MEKKSYCFKQADGLSLMIDAYLPEKPNGGAVLYYHGGAAMLGKREDTMGLELYLSRGFTYLSPDYRLAPEVKLETLLEDVRDAYRWLLDNGAALFDIDVNKITVVGCSFGGYLSLQMGATLAPRPACVLSFSGYGDLLGKMYARPDAFYIRTEKPYTQDYADAQYASAVLLAPDGKDRGAIYLRSRQQGTWNQVVAGLDPDKDLEAMIRFCPVRVMTCDMPPSFLIHGTADTDVSYDQAVQTAATLKSLGVAHEFVSLPCGHGVYGEGADEAMERSADFMELHALGRGKHG